jgi:phosphoglycolate phosphatase
MIINILFDLDGTLTNPKDGITRCIQFSLNRLGRDAPSADELLWCIGPPLKQSFSRLLESKDNGLLDLALLHYRERFSEVGIYENAVYPGIASALERIHAQGFHIFLATSKPTVFATRILDHFELMQFFHGIYGSELDGSLSDKGDLIAHILKEEGLNPELTLIVGDRSHDVVGGKKNGIMTAALTYGYGTRTEIEASEPDFIFHSPVDLALFLETRGPLNDRAQPIAETTGPR